MTALPAPARIPLLILGLAALLTGVLAGLARLGVDVPSIAATQAGTHAALMICAFFGTVISLERAVALDGLSAYLGPAAAGTGGVLLIAGAPLWVPQSLFVGAALVLLLGSFQVMQRQFALFTVMLALGAVCWLLGNLVWFVNGDLQGAVPFWLAFLVVTIAGERLELTRFLPVRRAAAPSFIALSCLVLGGMLFTPVEPEHGRIAFAAGLLALAAWLLRYDIARHNASQQGLTRFIAICLLSGYVWLATGAIAGLAGGFTPGHALYDAAMHAVALGFVFAMVFGHAPIIFPAVVKVKIPYHAAFYLPLTLLHISLVLRVFGDVVDSLALRQSGAIANAATLAVFIATMLLSVARGAWQPARSKRSRARLTPGG
ncbi:hypothetical protein ACFQ4M_04890 [Thauera mechernichensis]|uniref:Permease n=1 Tax=Thauera mechernichensis TaxID=82788 RepID=A0ABW3WCH8_9RHOO|nr:MULTISPECIES: hypothetical protein [Thauera]ENO82559.1 hypothetical protein B447_02628 [Thauera sp. 27]MDG3065897.1 hypothetical protein [Thauera mechernichensis]